MTPIDTSIPTQSYHDFVALGRLKGEATQDPTKALKETATQFEAYFLQQMMKSMRDTIEKSDFVDQGSVGFYEDLMDKEVAMQMAKRGTLGLGQLLEAQTARLQPSTQDVLQQKAQPLPLQKPGEPHLLHKPVELQQPSPAVRAYEIKPITGVQP